MDKLLAWALPAIRHARIPLVVGYFWLLDIWLIIDWVFGAELAAENQTHLVARIVVATEAIGEFGQGIALSLVAFLLGELVAHHSERLVKWLLKPKVPFDLIGPDAQRTVTEGFFRLHLVPVSYTHLTLPTKA